MTVFFAGAEVECFDISGPTTNNTSAGSFNASNARCCVRVNGLAAYADANIGERTSLWLHFGLKIGGTTGTMLNGVLFFSGETELFRLTFENGGNQKIALVKDSSELVSGDSNRGSSLVYYDFYFELGNPGVAKLYQDGALVFLADDIDLSASGVSAINKIRFMQTNNSWPSDYSEVIAADFPTVGSKLVLRPPNANGHYTEWDGDSPGNINGLNPGDTFISVATAGLRQSLALPDFPAPGADESIESVFVKSLNSADGFLSGDINHFLRIGSTDYDGAGITIVTEKTAVTEFPTNPATSGAWSASDLNSTEHGIRSRA